MKATTAGAWRRWGYGFRALRHQHFRALWIGLVVSAVGTWMQIVAQSLLVLRLSHGSAFALGCVSLAQACAFFLFALVGGGFADRLNRRLLLIASQSSLALLAMTLGLLTWTGVITLPAIEAIAFVSGAILSFDQPARAALLSSVVPQEDLLNAISLQSAVFNAAAIVGPALAGLVVNWIGLAADFFLNALSFIPFLLALAILPSMPSLVPTQREELIKQIWRGLESVRRDTVLVSALASYGILLFAGPSLQLLVPVLAVHRLHVGASMMGVLFSAAGVGAVIGALVLGGVRQPTMRLARGALVCWCGALALTGTATSVPITFCSLVLLGICQSIAGASTSAFLQSRVPLQQRGRVMSLNTLLVMGVRPLGDFPASAMISAIGAPITAAGAAMVVGVAGCAIYTKAIRFERSSSA
ncbi:MAG: MFS transporter [Acidobacteriaceae bacterium]|nr:MFS transporter [Acidobacteriaceae bacterium]